MNRSEFLQHLLFAGAALWLGKDPNMNSASPVSKAELPHRRLGRTDQKIGILAPGGYHLGQIASEKVAIAMIHKAIESGVNFFDTAESYQAGTSEERLGKALADKRKQVFLMTKTFEPSHRDAVGARRHIEGSLRRLRTDYLDLWQLHSVQSPADVDRAFREDGAMAYILQAKKEGKVRFVGVTGHRNPDANLRALHFWDRGWSFDTMQMPLNPLDYHQESFQKLVLPELVKRDIGVIAMKTSADGRLLRERLCSIGECLRFVWSLPVSVAVVGMTSAAELQENLQLARDFQPSTASEKQALLARLEPHAGLELEWYKRRAL